METLFWFFRFYGCKSFKINKVYFNFCRFGRQCLKTTADLCKKLTFSDQIVYSFFKSAAGFVLIAFIDGIRIAAEVTARTNTEMIIKVATSVGLTPKR